MLNFYATFHTVVINIPLLCFLLLTSKGTCGCIVCSGCTNISVSLLINSSLDKQKRLLFRYLFCLSKRNSCQKEPSKFFILYIATWEVETATLKVSGAGGGSGGAVSVASSETEAGAGPKPDPGLGAGRASTSDTESSVMGMNSEGVMAVVRSSDIIGDWSELSTPAPSSSPGHDPGVSPPAPGVMVVELGGSRFTSGGLW